MGKVIDKFNISRKTVLITGSTGFFGNCVAKEFLELGANVVLLSRPLKVRKQLLGLQTKYGKSRVHGFGVDFYNRKKFASVLENVTKRFKVDVLINNAFDFSVKTGFNTPNGRLENSTFEQWQAAFEAGIYWAVLPTQIIGRQMQKRKKGSVINICSMYSIVSPRPDLYKGTDKFNPPSYGVFKAGIQALTRYTASFWAKDGVRANSISPGAFPNLETETVNSIAESDPLLNRLRERTLLGRIGHPTDLIGALVFLSSDASSYMTGQAVVIDGGWTII